MSNKVSYKQEDRQWDVRINVQSDEYLRDLVGAIMDEAHGAGKFKYVLIGGVEVGTRPNHDDYKVRHVHIAAIFNNRASKASIIKNWGVIEGNGYYMEFSKVDPTSTVLFEWGELPADGPAKRKIERSDAEKKKLPTKSSRKCEQCSKKETTS
ncbi:hypothetical protein AaE_001192 [Aphanomyces astaci]|uniref:Uncharacterized protein n=1 Tax=Aphanomyces astaci TaxID=112090 RepID=A0A6A5AD35_APHAT|nr:hypothetical protein AaE_001192 [Aphanomyces astaci]